MKGLLKTFIIITISLKISEIALGNISFQTPWETLLIAAAALTAFEVFLKPVAKILLLPINLLTLGALRWVLDILGLFIATTFINGFKITNYYFPGIQWNGISLAPHQFNLIISYIILALFFNFTVSILGSILK